MPEAKDIVVVAFSYLQYLAGPLLIFTALATADIFVGFVVGLVRSVRKGYRI